MTSPAAAPVPARLLELLARDPSRPLVTHIGADGARTELSVRTFENNAAKAANLLRDDADLQPGDVVALALPPHWQTSVWLGACALVGAVAWLGGDPGSTEVEVAVVGPDGVGAAQPPLMLATALHPLGMPFAAPLPPGVLDAAVEVRSHGDRFTPAYAVAPDDPWLRTSGEALTHAQALDAAHELGTAHGAAAGSRVLCPSSASPLTVALALLALPLALDAAVVLLEDAGADVAAVADRERCDVVLM